MDDCMEYDWAETVGEPWLRMYRAVTEMQRILDYQFDEAHKIVRRLCDSTDTAARTVRNVSPEYDPEPVFALTARIGGVLLELETVVLDIADRAKLLMDGPHDEQ